jgi:UDP-N-acetylglucosamine diphosphorylase / glucose-1-phosphate thymidylyltransferase / UDP-N-acetylgalactosamine diphosphorylase / glucosamine-1-phosphate N-acetyltransferase / galactosamine-1-phosphate N-acetyltransferase
MNTRIVLFEDHFLRDMDPVCLTRPAYTVTCACYTLADIAALAGAEVQAITRGYMNGIGARTLPPARPAEGPTLFLNASIVPDSRYAERFRALASGGEPFICTCGQRVSAALVPGGMREQVPAEKLTGWLLDLKLPLQADEGFTTLDYPHQIVKHLRELFPINLDSRLRGGSYTEVKKGVYAAADVAIADTAVFRTRGGPVVLEAGVEVGEFSYFEGPVYVGPRTRIIDRAAVKERTCIGATCKIGGELEDSVIENYTNKQHHGFLGHAWIGSWVNLGAGTSNSDLKNTYGDVRLEYGDTRVDTGMQFMGCIMGDFAKSAINTSIFTGKIIGVSSMLYGFVGQNVPSFCNYARSFGQITECPVEQAVLIQKRMFARRGISQSPEDGELLRAVFELTRAERLISDEPPSL